MVRNSAGYMRKYRKKNPDYCKYEVREQRIRRVAFKVLSERHPEEFAEIYKIVRRQIMSQEKEK